MEKVFFFFKHLLLGKEIIKSAYSKEGSVSHDKKKKWQPTHNYSRIMGFLKFFPFIYNMMDSRSSIKLI